MTSPATLPASAVSPASLCAAFNAAFADYLAGAPDLPLEAWPVFLRRQGVSLDTSRVLASEGDVLAFALVCPRAGCSRIATMGARPAARGTGAAPRLLDLVVAEAAARGDSSVELEVFAQNTRALALYRSRGFAPVVELHGYERGPDLAADPGEDAFVATSPDEAIARLAAVEGLPYQVSGAAVATAPVAPTAWRHGDALLLFAARRPDHVDVVALVDTGPDQRDARALLRALLRRHPSARVRVPQLQRDDLGGRALLAEGFARLPLHQLLMRRPIPSAGDPPPPPG